MDVKIVFSDLDGTLLTYDKKLSPATRQMLGGLASRGIEFVPCSGRALSGLPKELLELPCCHYAVCSNGAAIAESRTGRRLFQSFMGIERSRALWERVRGLDVSFDIFAGGAIWSERKAYDRLDTYGIEPETLKSVKGFRTPTERTPEETLAWLAARGEDVERITLFWKTEEGRDAVIRAIEADPTLTWTNSVPHDIEVMDSSVSKGAALSRLCHHLGIPVSSSVAFGDGLNDAPLLAAAGYGVAMANGCAETKAAADALTATNDEDGVAKMMEKLLG
ncbi:MAG: Cof-type HAD-IIB family hydrolase [Atopobiaceae bacterium]